MREHSIQDRGPPPFSRWPVGPPELVEYGGAVVEGPPSSGSCQLLLLRAGILLFSRRALFSLNSAPPPPKLSPFPFSFFFTTVKRIQFESDHARSRSPSLTLVWQAIVCFSKWFDLGDLCLFCYGIQVLRSIGLRPLMLFGRLGSGKLQIENIWFLFHTNNVVLTRNEFKYTRSIFFRPWIGNMWLLSINKNLKQFVLELQLV
ncbi:hypothetical protein PVAP13_4NG315030 [Panicum virgatum]|uniref:Uncharacterized protein n=1 Tax=Panicum virgatum TaxID=38727 RepID=A0A8T0THZ0_PANVG|nr:hypothetical protein PVAP13_4NG315030 [Panicum virgatum]